MRSPTRLLLTCVRALMTNLDEHRRAPAGPLDLRILDIDDLASDCL